MKCMNGQVSREICTKGHEETDAQCLLLLSVLGVVDGDSPVTI